MKHYNYKKETFVGGHIEYITPCPNGIEGQYTHELIMVGSQACQCCQYFHHIELENQSVACGFAPEQDPKSHDKFNTYNKRYEKKDFNHPAHR